MIRIVTIQRPSELTKLMKDMQVDPYGIEIMVPKGTAYLVKINHISTITANILKQEMLSFGADAAVARHALTGSRKSTDCLLIGNLSQFIRLQEKLKEQPFGLKRLAADLRELFKNYQRDEFILRLGKYRLRCGKRSHIMGIVNLTPDSFSGDGLLAPANRGTGSKIDTGWILEHIERMAADGADIIDIGGESSRPGARPIPVDEELRRTNAVIKTCSRRIKIPLSIDTCKPEVAQQALDNGAVLVNDISGLKNNRMRTIIAKEKCGVVIMHMKGTPRTMQKNPRYAALPDDIIESLHESIRAAADAGIGRDKIIVDPGIGFGKTVTHNLVLLKQLNEFKVLGTPILVGPSRKSFIGSITGSKSGSHLYGTIATCVTAIHNGAHIVRVHDVKAVREALNLADAVENTWERFELNL